MFAIVDGVVLDAKLALEDKRVRAFRDAHYDWFLGTALEGFFDDPAHIRTIANNLRLIGCDCDPRPTGDVPQENAEIQCWSR